MDNYWTFSVLKALDESGKQGKAVLESYKAHELTGSSGEDFKDLKLLVQLVVKNFTRSPYDTKKRYI